MSIDGNTFTSAGTFPAPFEIHTLTTLADGLVAGQVYYFRVRAINEKGSSEWSSTT